MTVRFGVEIAIPDAIPDYISGLKMVPIIPDFCLFFSLFVCNFCAIVNAVQCSAVKCTGVPLFHPYL
jgi:hypothetical protein